MKKFSEYRCVYVRRGKVAKDGNNKDREYSIYQFCEESDRASQSEKGRYTYTVFCFDDEGFYNVDDIIEAIIDSNNGRDRLIAVNE